jgi:2-polyprenyl-3-methyl-5-hydroxy-6-metoxy-1,4-benzoquinol methylase
MKRDLKDNTSSNRAKREIKHSKILARSDPELIWNWNTPAGQLRAKRRAEIITRGSRLGPGVCALEIGCGAGMFTEMFAQSGANLVAVDISSDLLKKARTRNLPSDRVLFLEKRFEDCDIDGSYDAVIGSSVLHHLDIEDALKKIYCLLKPGGFMCFAEPNMLNPQVFIERKFRFLLPCLWYISSDETAIVRWKFRDLLRKTGFEKIEIMPFDWLHPATPIPLIRLIGNIGKWLENTPVFREFAGSLYIQCRRPLI